jgi:hypothetical protein
LKGIQGKMEIEGEVIKHGPDFSEYKKKILEQDQVILCVAEAEKLVVKIGRSLLDEVQQDETPSEE